MYSKLLQLLNFLIVFNIIKTQFTYNKKPQKPAH